MHTANDIMDMYMKNVIDDKINEAYGIRISEWCDRILYDPDVSIEDYPLYKFNDPHNLSLSMKYLKIVIKEEHTTYVAGWKFKTLLRSMLDKAKVIMPRREWYNYAFQYNQSISPLCYYKYLCEKPNSCYVRKKQHLKLYLNDILVNLICDNDVKKIIRCGWLKYGIHGEDDHISLSTLVIVAAYNKNTYKFILKKLPFYSLGELPRIYDAIVDIAPRVDISIKILKHMIKLVRYSPEFQFVIKYKHNYKKFYFLLYCSFNAYNSDKDIGFFMYKLHRRTETAIKENMTDALPIYKLMIGASKLFTTKNLIRMAGYYI